MSELTLERVAQTFGGGPQAAFIGLLVLAIVGLSGACGVLFWALQRANQRERDTLADERKRHTDERKRHAEQVAELNRLHAEEIAESHKRELAAAVGSNTLTERMVRLTPALVQLAQYLGPPAAPPRRRKADTGANQVVPALPPPEDTP